MFIYIYLIIVEGAYLLVALSFFKRKTGECEHVWIACAQNVDLNLLAVLGSFFVWFVCRSVHCSEQGVEVFRSSFVFVTYVRKSSFVCSPSVLAISAAFVIVGSSFYSCLFVCFCGFFLRFFIFFYFVGCASSQGFTQAIWAIANNNLNLEGRPQ